MPWLKRLKFDPIAPLLSSDNQRLVYFARRDLLKERTPPVSSLWTSPNLTRLLKRQNTNGSFRYPGARPVAYPPHLYPLLETWKQFRFLVEQFGADRRHEPTRLAAEFLFSCQTSDGDIRGFIGDQYATYYTGAVLALLIKAGYADDPRVEKGMRWLLDMRQNDGGWTIPMITHKLSREEQYRLTAAPAQPLEPDRDQPFSHNWTGMVLRAFAAHPRYRKQKDARAAAALLKSRFFQPDVYSSYKAARYWTTLSSPFWWNHLVAALDSITTIGLPADDPDVRDGLNWFIENQQMDGLWPLDPRQPSPRAMASAKNQEMRAWVGLDVCRILARSFAE